MKLRLTFVRAASLGLVLSMSSVALAADGVFNYPDAKKLDLVEDHHGKKVPDPYRWLEDPDTPEARKWIEAENKVTFKYLETIPERKAIEARLTELWDYEKWGIPFKRGGRYFFTRNDGLQNQSPLYWVKSLGDEPKLLIDPNTLSEDGTVALGGYSVSDDGKLIAYALASGGSDWREWHVREVDTGKDLSDKIEWSKFSGASWTPDGKGFYYSRYDAPKEGEELKGANYFQKLYYHKIGTPQSQDRLVYERKDHKDWGFGGEVTDDGKYLIISVWKGTERKNLLFYKSLESPDAPVVELIDEFEAQYNFIDNEGSVFYFFNDLETPRGQIIAIDTKTPQRASWKKVIPQTEYTLRGANIVGGKIVAEYLKDAQSLVKVFDMDGKFVRTVELPGIGSAGGFGGKKSDTETFYSFSSYTDPGSIYRYDVATGESTLYKKPEIDIRPENFETRQVFYKSKDGTRVPMFITHKKGLKLDGNNATLLYGYGGFNIPLTPGFSVSRYVWMEMGGVYAVANLRGGGEYGAEWHQAGTKLTKQNVFDDFISAAEWLIENDYTRPDKLAIEGGSNGGLLVGACMTQRPDLFGVAIPRVGVLDMLRFHKFTIGWAWTSDYGSPDNEEEFNALLAYSPYHNLKPGTAYPATLITTGDHDDRVVPAHSFKFAAALQEAHSGPDPVMIRIETRAGHGAGKPTWMRIEEAADIMGFTAKNLGMNPDLPEVSGDKKTNKPKKPMG